MGDECRVAEGEDIGGDVLKYASLPRPDELQNNMRDESSDTERDEVHDLKRFENRDLQRDREREEQRDKTRDGDRDGPRYAARDRRRDKSRDDAKRIEACKTLRRAGENLHSLMPPSFFHEGNS